MSEELSNKRRFCMGRKLAYDESMMLVPGIICGTIEAAEQHAKSRNLEWCVLELHDVDAETSNPGGVLCPYILATKSVGGAEIAYDCEANPMMAIKRLATTSDTPYFATVAKTFRDENPMQEWLLAFSVANEDFVFSYRVPYAEQPLGWCDGQYRVKVELPKVAKEPTDEND